jgi:DNA modification methylase
MILNGDAFEILSGFQIADESIDCCVTSPPYWGLRDYGVAGQLGLEETPEEFIKNMVTIFREVKRVLKSDGTLWLNLGDSYAGSGKVYSACPIGAVYSPEAVAPGFYFNCECRSTLVWIIK